MNFIGDNFIIALVIIFQKHYRVNLFNLNLIKFNGNTINNIYKHGKKDKLGFQL